MRKKREKDTGQWVDLSGAGRMRARDLDDVRLEVPQVEELIPIDHRTRWGRQLLGVEGLTILRQRFGPRLFLRDIRRWLRAQGIDWREIDAAPLPWSEFLALLADEKPAEDARPEDCITLAVAVSRFLVSRSTLKRAINDGRLRTHRSTKGRMHEVSEAEVAKLFMRR